MTLALTLAMEKRRKLMGCALTDDMRQWLIDNDKPRLFDDYVIRFGLRFNLTPEDRGRLLGEFLTEQYAKMVAKKLPEVDVVDLGGAA